MLVTEGATPDAEAVETPKSMDDTIRETLRSLKDGGAQIEETPAVSPSDTPETPAAPEDDEQKAQRIRDAQGKFAKVGAPPDPEAVAAGNPPEAPEVKPEAPVDPAPNTWRKEVAEKWGTLPAEVRAEVARREADFHKGIAQYKDAATQWQTMERAISPFMATMQALNVTPDKAVSALMAADHRLRYGAPHEKQQAFAQLAQQYGVDLAAMPTETQAPIDPTVAYLKQQVEELRGHIQNQQQSSQQQAEQTLNSEISAFAADPKHSHFESVKGHMASLLQAGLASSLPDAYEQAVYANPTTRALVIAQQQEQARKEAAEKAQAAKQVASINVKARPSMPVSAPIGSMDDTIRSTLRRLQGA